MLSYVEPTFIKKFFGESDFSNFGQNRNDAKKKSVIFLPTILKRYNFLFFLFFFRIMIYIPPLGTNLIECTLVTEVLRVVTVTNPKRAKFNAFRAKFTSYE